MDEKLDRLRGSLEDYPTTPRRRVEMESKYGGKRHFIYLAGSISSDPKTYTWRRIFMDLMQHDGVVILDPCDTQFNRKLLEGEGWNLETIVDMPGRNLLKPKDFKMIDKSSIMVWNVDYFTEDKPMIGSVIEFEWAVKWFGIPVIIICSEPDTNPYALHPWIRQYAGAIVPTIEDAIYLIREFFL